MWTCIPVDYMMELDKDVCLEVQYFSLWWREEQEVGKDCFSDKIDQKSLFINTYFLSQNL